MLYIFFSSHWALWTKGLLGFQPRKKNLFATFAHLLSLLRCMSKVVFVYCIFTWCKKNFFFENFRQFFFVVSFFRWPLKIFDSKFTISCCWSSRLCKSKRTIPYNWRWCTFSWFLTGLLSKGPFFLSVKCVVNYLMSIDKWNKKKHLSNNCKCFCLHRIKIKRNNKKL